MKSQELLFELIHSLTQTEKRYFKLFSKLLKSDSNYLLLFEAILKQKKYDEKLLIKQFDDKKFVNQLSVAKNYLLNLILRSLISGHHKAKKSIELNDYLSQIEILYLKGLYKLCYKKLCQAKKIAKEYQLTNYQLILNSWELKIIDHLEKKPNEVEVLKETKQIFKNVSTEVETQLKVKELKKIWQTSMSSGEAVKIEVQKLIESCNQIKLKNKENTFRTNINILSINGIGYSFLEKKEKSLHYKKKSLDIFIGNPHQMIEEPSLYKASINNLLMHYVRNGYDENFIEYLEMLKNVKTNFSHMYTSFNNSLFNFQVGYYLAHREDKELLLCLNNMLLWYDSKFTVREKISKIICEYNIALVYFYFRDTKNCLKWCSSCFNMFDMKTTKYRHDLAVSTLTLQVLIYIDLAYFDLAKKHLDMIYGLAKKNKYGKVEMSIFNLLRDIVKIENKELYLDKLNKLIIQQNVSAINLDKDTIVFWIERKLK